MAVKELLEMTEAKLWSEVRQGLASRWTLFKRACQVLNILKERYESDDKHGEMPRNRRATFFKIAQSEIGYSSNTIYQMIRVAQNKHFMYLEDSVGARIDISAIMLLSQKKVQALRNYKQVVSQVKQKAIKGKDMVTYEAVRHMLYPRENRTNRFQALSDHGKLVYIPKQKGAKIEDVLDDIEQMIDNGAIYKETKRHVKRRVRRTEA